MTTVEKRRSGRKSGGRRKHSDGGYSDTSSAGSFPDENDREVSNLTDRAFRSLCIGDEAVYNDSDLSLSSPCTQRDKQLAFSHHGRDREREELKRAAHENFSLRVQQYEEDWIHGGMYGSEIHRDPQWEVYGERTHGGVSATFQHSFVETSQQERSQREEQLSILSNGATELNSQQLRSRSRVSSLIRAFNSEGQRDVVGMDDQFREWNDETSWDKSALMSIQRELSEFSTSYQQNFNSGHFPSSGPFSPPDTNFYSSEVAAVAHMSHNSAASFMRSSHSKHSMSAQVNCNSNFFIHSEFSPFKVWRDHNRFPFQHGQVSGFMHCSEFPKWYETPMYKELSLQDQPQAPCRGVKHSHFHHPPVVPPAAPRSTSTSMVMQKAPAMEKRCESELAGHYPHRKRTQSLGPNRLPSQRPSTASPTTEMSRRVRDTISSVKALQEKIKRMAEQNTGAPGVMNEQGGYYCNNNLHPCENNAVTVAPNVVSGNTSTTPFKISQMLTPSANSHQEAEASDFQHYDLSAPPVEHPPVRAESRGATPDVRMSSYKSRATSLLFNLKDNRKRVKSTYSPTKFKGLENQERNRQPSNLEPRETVIDIPDFPDPYNQFSQFDEPIRTNAAAHQYANQYQSSFLNSQTATTHTTQYPGYTVSDDQTAQMQGQMVHHSGFTGFIPGNYTSNQLTNGQNLPDDSVSRVPYNQGMTNTVGTLENDVYRLQQSSTVRQESKLNAESNHTREYLQSQTNYEQPSNEIFGSVFTKVNRYEQLKDSKHDYNNVSSQNMYRQTYSQDTEKLRLQEKHRPLKTESGAFMERTRQETQPGLKKEIELRESVGAETSSHLNTSNQPQQCALNNDTGENPAWYGEPQSLAFQDKKGFQKYSGHFENSHKEYNWKTNNDNKHPDQESRNQHGLYYIEDKLLDMHEKGQRKLDAPIPKDLETQMLQPMETNPSFEPRIQRDPDHTSDPAITSPIKDRQVIEIKAEQVFAENVKAEHQQAELAKAPVQVELPTAESAGLVLADQTRSENIRAEEVKSEPTQQEMLKKPEAENIAEKKIKEPTEEPSEKQDIVQKVLDEPRNIANELQHMREEQSHQANAEQTEKQKQKEKQVKTEVPKINLDEKTRFKQTQREHAIRTNINAEQFRKEQLSKVQAMTEQTVDKIRAENFSIAGSASRKAEQTSTGEMEKQQFKAEQEKATVAKPEKVNTDQLESKEVRQSKDHKYLVFADLANVEQHTTLLSLPKERKLEKKTTEQAKAEKTKMNAIIPELSKAQNMQERSAKLTAKLTATQPAKSEPDKVEQVKTELAKAKAELAKIKEKMRSEQKEKVKNAIVIKEDGTAKSKVPVQLNIDQTPQREVPVVRNSSREPVRGADEYDRLREKYGFIEAASTNKKNVSATENASSTDNKETQASSLDKPDTVNKEKSMYVVTPADAANTAGAANLESTEVTESQYVYSESLKEFKLSCASDSKTKRNKEDTGNSVTDKLMDDRVNKLGKSDPVKDADVSLHKDSDSIKVLPHKTKSNDHNFIPPKALPHKERAQTKQEILTSKIKAHAEKEISAIKEKGFAMRDGSKSFGKLLPSSQSVNVRQRPPSQDTYKKNETMSSSSVTMKHQTDSSRVQLEPNISPFCSTTTSSKSSASAIQPDDHLLKQILQKSTKANSDVPEQPRETKQTECSTVNFTNGSVQNIKQEKNPKIVSPMKTNEQAAKDEQGKLQIKSEEISIKHKEELKEIPVEKTDIHNKKKERPPEADEVATENILGQEARHEDPEPSLNLFLGQKEDPIADDSLQIMGIMVTVRDRNPPLDIGQRHNSTLRLMNATEKESSDLVLDEGHASTHPDEGQKTTALKEAVTEKVKNIQQNHSAVKEDQTKVVPEHENKTLISETRKVPQDTTETNLKQDGSINAKPQSETKPEPLALKGVTVTAPSKNKVLAETQPLLHKQDIITRETKDPALTKSTKEEVKTEGQTPQKVQMPHTNNNEFHNEVNSSSDNKGNAKSQLKHGVQPSVAEDKTSVRNQSENSNSNGENAPLLEEKRPDPISPITFNKTSTNSNLTGNENSVAFPKQQNNEKHFGENIEEDDNIHIESIAIKVVPAATTKDKVNHSKTSLSDFVVSNEHTEIATSSCKENTLKNEDTSKDLSPACSGKKLKDNLDDKLVMQQVLDSENNVSDSLQSNNRHSSSDSNNPACQNIQPENAKPDNVKAAQDLPDESNIQLESDYFQVQRVTETNKESHSAAVERDAVKEREVPGMQPNETLNKESYKEEKIDAFVFNVDKDKSETVESGSKSFHEESVKRKICATEDTLVSKQTDGSVETLSNNEKMETSQTNQTREHPTEQESSLSVTERHSSRRLHPKRENKVHENPEVKPKPKERVSTIPEISALADYARLKVIVSEDKDTNPVQEFPPNKKEGFFPLIHTRHSRRPVFTAEPQQYSMKEKTLPNNAESTAKVNKEPKALVFPITEKEHQRTGMFKLGDKERQDKMLPEGKVNENIIDSAATNVQHNTKSDLLTSQMEQMARVGTQQVNQVDVNSFQQHNHPLQATTPSQNTSEELTYFDKMDPPLATMGQMHNMKENITPQQKEERIIKQVNKDEESEDKQKNRLKNEKPANQKEQTKEKQQDRIKQPDEEQSSRSKYGNREEERKIKHMLEESRASHAEEERRARDREAIAIKIKERREKQREMERRMEEERQVKQREAQRAQKEEELKSGQRKDDMASDEKMRIKCEEERRAAQEERHMRSGQAGQQWGEHRGRTVQDEHQRRAEKQEQKKAAQEQQQRRAEQEEEHRRAAQEEQRRAAQEEQQRKAAQEEQQRRAEQKRYQRRAEQEGQNRRAAQEEQKRRAAQEEQQRRAAQEEQQSRAAQEEQQRRAAQEEQQRRAAQEEQQRRAAQEEQQRRAAQEEQQRRAAHEEQQRRAAQEEQQRRAAQEEQQRIAEQELKREAAQEEQQKRAAQEQERRAMQEKQQRRATQEEQKIIDAQELQKRAAQEKQRGGSAQGEHERVPQEKERRATQEELQRRVVQEEQQRRAKQIITDDEEEKRKRLREENKAASISHEKCIKQNLENKAEQQIVDQLRQTEKTQLLTRIQKHEEEKDILKQREESQTKGQKALLLEESQVEMSPGIMQEHKLLQNEDEFQTKKKEEKEFSSNREKMKAAQIEKRRQVTQMDALQYYAITSAEPEKKPKERKLFSPAPSQQRNTPGLESTDWPYIPHAPLSPAPSLPRSTASSPALGVKPLMFRVKDNTMRGSSFTKSVKPRFHKNFREELWGGSPVDRGMERGEDHEIMRHGAGTPVHPDSGSNRLMAINESSISRSVSSLDGYSAPVSYHRPYSRRSIVIDDDDSRSVFSTTSDGVESFSTSAADLADIRGLYDYDRPESACSFSSDVSRSMGKPPSVPPKSEKALRRAQRLTTRRMKKESSKHAETNPVGLHKEGPIICSSSSTEVRSSNRHAVASPHFSPPVSLAHARTVGSSLPPPHADQQSSHRSFHAFPHATGPISLPNSSADANPAVTLPAAPKTVTHVPSSPTLHHVNRPAPVTQYQVESSYPQSYPLTQRKVLQDLGSGQYFVVDVPVEVKTKTFIDPETGKYVQLNVRESGQSIARHQPQQTCPQPQRQIEQQQLPLSQASPAGKPAVLYQGHHGYPHNYQPAAIKPLHSDSTSAPATAQPDQQPLSENQSCGYPAPETGQNTVGRRYSPEKTPYMDTVNDMDKRHNRVYGTHGSYESFPECDTNSQLAGRSVCENENSAPSQYQPREIITMCELEDFMEISDW